MIGVLGLPSIAGAGEESAVFVPTVTGPIAGGKGAPTLVTFDPSSVGYETAEYFMEGTATSYAPASRLKRNGRWELEPDNTARYKTRVVVYRPADDADFSGTVFVEWFNVSSGFDVAVDWTMAHTQIIRSGGAYVGVSAQAVGVQGGQRAIGGAASGGIVANDPERYGSLTHPGDEFSYDIFTQAGIVGTGQADVNPLEGLEVERVIGMGESQSASRLVSYTNGIHPQTRVFSGFLIHSRGASGSGFGSDRRAGVPRSVITRTDIDVPVMTVETDTDITGLGYVAARQKDSRNFRLWEIAGTAHADAYTTGLGFSDVGDGQTERLLLDPAEATGGPLGCSEPINAGPHFAVLNAAVFHLERWASTDEAPPRAPRLEVTDDAEPEIARDEHGNARGGIRTPLVDVPIATLSGEPNAGGDFCSLFGRTVPFDAAKLAELYPTHADYVKKFNASADKAVKRGFLLEENAEAFKAAADELPIPS